MPPSDGPLAAEPLAEQIGGPAETRAADPAADDGGGGDGAVEEQEAAGTPPPPPEPPLAAAAPRQAKFKFAPSDRPFAPLNDADLVAKLNQWCMFDSLKVQRFRFDQPFQRYELDDFLLDFFNDEAVALSLQVLGDVRGGWTSVGQPGKCSALKTEKLNCTATSMAFFDRLYECGVVRQSGSIVGCIPEYTEDDFAINQEMGKLMLLDDSEHYDVFSEAERSELIFRIFQHMTLGGPLNQYEDEIGPYFDVVKKFYKGLISVAKDPKTGAVFTTSVAAQIKVADGMLDIFPNKQPDHPQNFCYVVLNPTRREVSVLYYAWCGD